MYKGDTFTAKRCSGSVKDGEECTITDFIIDNKGQQRICIDKGSYALTTDEFESLSGITMKPYRITIYQCPELGIRDEEDAIHVDVLADEFEDAVEFAFRKKGITETPKAAGVKGMQIPKGTTNIALKFAYTERDRTYYQYMVIRAADEEHAKDYYNFNFKGKRFFQPWPHKPEKDGNCIYGKAIKTYFVTCPGYNFDATK